MLVDLLGIWNGMKWLCIHKSFLYETTYSGDARGEAPRPTPPLKG